ncbi:sensor histidine kinase [Streptomyces sp. NBC_01462]|uniref:sensor histidine kinase n=1 Tax=Streptomyces sp. NBC_01462 TaxID=2903876 RepID=UPI002E33AF97|nr:sensor histidine kinase [Streptomyces sp. NBC_01462]
MSRRSEQSGDAFVGEALGELSPRAERTLWWGSAGLVLTVLGISVSVAGADHVRRMPIAVTLVLAQAGALRWQARAPVAVLAVNAVSGLVVWALLPAVTLTGAMLAAQITLCVLSASRPWRASVWALAAMCLVAPLAFGAGGPAGVAVWLLTVILAWTAGQWRSAQKERTRAELRRAVVEERARIAREVHDVVAHTLSVVVIQAGAADDVFAQRPEQARQALRAIETGARSALGELRLLLRAFSSDEAEDRNMEQRESESWLARLEELAETVRATGMAVRVYHEGATGGLPAAVDKAAYRIVQEALTNTLRHAVDADEVSVRVAASGDCVEVTVVDNGRTTQSISPAGGAGRGLVGMKERVRLVGGSLRAGPVRGGGFEVTARLPVERAS